MRVTTSNYEISGKNHICQSKLNPPEQLIYPPEKKIIGTNSILARDKSRMLPTDPLFTL